MWGSRGAASAMRMYTGQGHLAALASAVGVREGTRWVRSA